MKWGLVWGPLQGFWFLAPQFLITHVLYPNALAEWFFVSLFLLGVFATIGVLCSIFVTYLIAVYTSIVKPVFADPSKAHAFIVGVLTPIVYLFLGYFFVWAKLGTILPLTDALAPLDIIALVGIIAAVSAYHAVLKSSFWPPFLKTTPLLVGCIILGAVLVPFRITDPRSTRSVTESALVMPPASSASKNVAPLLLIGIDGANWKSIGHALNKNSLPTIDGLIKQGVHGTVEGLWPPYLSGPAWAAILTGFSREKTGIYEDLEVLTPLLESAFQLPLTADIKLVPLLIVEHYFVRLGLIKIKPLSRPVLRQTPIWEILSDAFPRKNIAVVRFWFTHPPETKPGTIIVSDWAGIDAWKLLDVDTRTEMPTVSPVQLSEQLLKFYNSSVKNYNLRDFVEEQNYRQPNDTFVDPISILYNSLEIDSSTLAATEYLVRQKPVFDVLMVYLGGFDMISHAFWQYRFPEDFPRNPPAKMDIDRLGPVIDRYLEFVDRRLGELISSFPRRPNVVIVSDHGHEANQSPLIWRAKHAPDGIFIASGPNIAPRKEGSRVSYFDIVPTILHLFGLEKPRDLRGTSAVKMPIDLE